jgi:hypothetical protein
VQVNTAGAAGADREQGDPAAATVTAAATMEVCPICHDPLATGDFAMLPCGHTTCLSCMDLLTSRLPASLPLPARKVACPTCRLRVPVPDISYVDSGGEM